MSFPVPTLEIGPPGEDVAPGAVLQQWLDDSGRRIARGGWTQGQWWMHWDGLATFWFDQHGAVTARPVRAHAAAAIHDAFVRGVTPVVLLARGCEALHGSAVTSERGVIALCGRSGTGKSTLALALSAAGLPQFADDTVAYLAGTHQPSVVRLPFATRVSSEGRSAAGLRHGAPARLSTEDTLPLFRVYDLVRDATTPPDAPQFARLAAGAAFQRLLAHSHPFDMGADNRRRAFFENLMACSRQIEVWECRFAPSLSRLPALARAVHDHAGHA